MIDLRCHLFAAAGTDGFAESLAVCRQAVIDGVHIIVATRDLAAAVAAPSLPCTTCADRLARLQRALRDALSLRLGYVLEFRLDLPALLARHGAALTLGGGRYALVALPALRIPAETEDVWAEIRRLGFAVIVARPECSPELRRDAERLRLWLASGVMLQLDAASILGTHGHEVQKFALDCARTYRGSVVVASNARHAHGRHASLAAARATLAKKGSARLARRLLDENPAAIINSAPGALSAKPARTQADTFWARLLALRPQKTLWHES